MPDEPVPLLPGHEPDPDAGATWQLKLRDVGDPLMKLGYPARPAALRLRAALKSLLRRFGLKEV